MLVPGGKRRRKSECYRQRRAPFCWQFTISAQLALIIYPWNTGDLTGDPAAFYAFPCPLAFSLVLNVFKRAWEDTLWVNNTWVCSSNTLLLSCVTFYSSSLEFLYLYRVWLLIKATPDDRTATLLLSSVFLAWKQLNAQLFNSITSDKSMLILE